MNTKEAFEDPRIVMLEENMLHWYDLGKEPEMTIILKNALWQRWMALRDLVQYDDEAKSLLLDFNERIKASATILYHKTKAFYDGIMELHDGKSDLEVEGKLLLGYDYPKDHPVQTQRAETMWELMTQGYMPQYNGGCTWPLRWNEKREALHDNLEEWLGMADTNDNWNEGLDQKWSKDMHLVYPFHHLYDNCHFSLYDLVYVNEFGFEINVRIDGGIVLTE